MDDLISRQEAIDAVENIDCSDGVGISALKCEAVDDGVTAIKALPSAQPEKVDTPTVDTPNCDDTISRQAAIDEIDEWIKAFLENGHKESAADACLIQDGIIQLPSAHPEKRTEERTETHSCDYINRKDAIDAHYEYCNKHPDAGFPVWSLKILEDLPSAQPEVLACGEGELIAQPEIIRCNDCKHWTQTTGNMRGFGLGDCDYINAKLVNCNGFCYWAERRTDEV